MNDGLFDSKRSLAGASAIALVPAEALAHDFFGDPESSAQAFVEQFCKSHPRLTHLLDPGGPEQLPVTPSTKYLAVSQQLDQMKAFLGWLRELSDALERNPNPVERALIGPATYEHPLSEVQANFIQKLGTPIIGQMAEMWGDFELMARHTLFHSGKHDPSALDQQVEEMQKLCKERLHSYLLEAPFPNRVILKPEGHGDHGTISMILDKNSLVGSSPFAVIVNAFHLADPSAEAHRNRVKMLTEVIADQVSHFNEAGLQPPFRMLNVGCGPAQETRAYLRAGQVPTSLELTLVDLNSIALDLAERGILEIVEINPDLDVKVEAKKQNIFKEVIRHKRQLIRSVIEGSTTDAGESVVPISDTAAKEEPKKYNLIFCAGLYDYLNDADAELLTHKLAHQLTDNGLLVITNVSDTNPSEWGRTLLLGWKLALRSSSDMLKLVENLDDDKLARKLLNQKENVTPAEDRSAAPINILTEKNVSREFIVQLRADETGVNYLLEIGRR